MTSKDEHLLTEIERIQKGGAEKYHDRNREQKKLFARDRLKLLLDDGNIEFEDGIFAENQNPELPADGNITGVVPQIAIMFGPSPAGAAYTPAFADIAIMVEGNASAYLGSPRMAEMVTHEKVTLEEMGGARMHCTVSGLGDFLVESEEDAIRTARDYFRYMPQNYLDKPAAAEPQPPASDRPLKDIVPEAQNKPFNMYDFIYSLVDGGSFLEVKELFAQDLITGFARLRARTVGIVANQPRVKGGVLFVDSSDKGTRLVNTCNAFNIPLLFLAAVSGFFIG